MKSKKILQSMLAKTIAYFLTVISFFLAGASVFGAYFMLEEDFYTRGEEQLKKDYLSLSARNDGRVILYNFLNGDEQSAVLGCEGTNVMFEILDAEGDKLCGNYDDRNVKYQFESTYNRYNMGERSITGDDEYTVRVYIDGNFPATDQYSFMDHMLGILYSLRYAVFAVAALSAMVCIAGFNFLMCSAGYRRGVEGAQARGLEKLPFDLLAGILFLGSFMTVSFGFDGGIYDYLDVIAKSAGVLLAFIVLVRFCMIAAVQLKTRTLWKNTVICRILRLARRAVEAFGRAFGIFVRGLPLIWNTVLLVIGITALEILWFFLSEGEPVDVAIAWFIEKILFVPAILYLALVLRKLQKGGEALAEGDFDYKVDTKWMFWDFKEHGENLNSMADGMNLALEERMRSEHLKTELITNVSHDIKTPLTSIINYAELIGDEPTENEKIVEYAQVLKRQSARLKKLIEDLVEASKASTGNVEVHLAPCEVGVLLTQTVGEYEQRLQENGLTLVARQPEEAVCIMADGKLLWRVFDNLLNNICKYAQSGTRVYLSVEKKDGKALIAFKNTSRYPLDITAGELMERFVRGDSSRHTEGNGLGLSIAQSLTQLQNGNLLLTVDGDFFKVVLEFESL